MLQSCTSCGRHVRVTELACPHCGAALRPSGRSAAAILLGLALAGCPEPSKDLQALYGVAETGNREDADGDGWTVAAGDCDDDDETIHPDATETPDDEIDSNCDGADDT
jgi:hypothetical protein